MSLLKALKVIPWNDVVAAAPAVVRGAQQLWNKVRHEAPPVQPVAASALDERVQALEARLAAQAQEAASASELIAALAEQNARLIEAVEELRRRSRLLMAAVAVLGVAAALAVVFMGR